MRIYLISLWIILFGAGTLQAQDSVRRSLTQLPPKYLQQVSSKADKYYSSITSKTEKTLEKLSKWEGKIKSILEKASPETAQRLFGNDQLTFAGLLQKYKEGKAAADGYKGKYDAYRDKVTTSLHYIETKKEELNSKAIEPLKAARNKVAQLNNQLENTEAVQEFIRERKKQLLQQAIQYIGKSKYLQKINKEAYYYAETLRNYKEIFNDTKKTEEFVIKLLQKIPAFKDFFSRQSQLAGLFPMPSGGQNGQVGFAGLQTRSQVTAFIQNQNAMGSMDFATTLEGEIRNAQGIIDQIRNKINGSGGSGLETTGFKPNNQKSKTFKQRLEFGTNLQNQRTNYFFPTTTDLGLSVGYKLNDKSIIGLGSSFKMSWGKDIRHIKFSGQGLSLRSFLEWKIKGNFFASGGFEYNYQQAIPNVRSLYSVSDWKRSALLGITKTISLKGKFLKKTKIQLLYDFFYRDKLPITEPIKFRVGYVF